MLEQRGIFSDRLARCVGRRRGGRRREVRFRPYADGASARRRRQKLAAEGVTVRCMVTPDGGLPGPRRPRLGGRGRAGYPERPADLARLATLRHVRIRPADRRPPHELDPLGVVVGIPELPAGPRGSASASAGTFLSAAASLASTPSSTRRWLLRSGLRPCPARAPPG